MSISVVIRKLDSLGRIVIPDMIREKFDLAEGSGLQIYSDDNLIYLKSEVNRCAICGSEDCPIYAIKAKFLCESCLAEIDRVTKGEFF